MNYQWEKNQLNVQIEFDQNCKKGDIRKMLNLSPFIGDSNSKLQPKP